MADLSNYSIRDEIREFWSERAATFDESVGHEVFSEAERRGWHRLIRRHLGEGAGRPLLDLACGTGVVSHLMADMGFAVTGLDWSEAMLAQARAKAERRGSGITFLTGDAERTMLPDAGYDAITNRHLVWTLVDVPAAFAEWFRLLKPGGKLLIVDGNMGRRNWVKPLHERFLRLTRRAAPAPQINPAWSERLQRIRREVWFSDQMHARDVVALLERAGFTDCRVDRGMRSIHWAQARKMDFWRGFERLASDRYAICATKPADRVPGE